MFKWLKNILSSPKISFYELEDKDYSDEELIQILETKNLRVGTGNVIVLSLIKRILERIKKNDTK